MSQITLTKEQLGASDFLQERHSISILNGAAGSGKTTVVSEFFRAEKDNLRIRLAATTHKAAHQLSKTLDIKAVTIHSFLGLKRTLKHSKHEYVYNPNHQTEDIDVLFIDEASMISPPLFSYIKQCSLSNNFRVVLIGDERQLNPVNCLYSPIFTAQLPTYTLTEILRHTNDIIDLSRNLNLLMGKIDGECYQWVDKDKLDVSLLVEANGSDKAKYITWTNKTVKAMNAFIRTCIYGQNVAQLELGEVILMNEPYGPYRNNEEVEIKELKESHRFIKYLPIPNTMIRTYYVNNEMHIINNEDMHLHEVNIKVLLDLAIKKTIPWRKYYDYKESFAAYQYNHAITVHKAQGSTYDVAFVNVSEMMKNSNAGERDRLLYTAITRAKYKNYLV